MVTLDTPLLGWRPRDLGLAHLPFLRGQGLAQYTSDPVFRAQLSDVDLAPLSAPVSLAAIGTALAQKEIGRAHV